MTTATILLLLAAAASTIAFSPPNYAGRRLRRDIASGSQGAYSTSGAGNFDQGESKSNPSLPEVCKGFVDVRGGEQDKGYNSVGYPGAFNFPSYMPPVPYYGPAFQPQVDFNALMQEHFYHLMRLAQQNGYNPGFQAAQGQYPAGTGIAGGDGQVSAGAVAQLDTRGGFGAASISPPPPGDLGLRFGAVGPPSGNTYGVYTSSSSGTSDVNGQRKNYKQSTAVINDNGKVTTFHAQDP